MRGPLREEVYKIVDGERIYQDAGRGNAKAHPGRTGPLTIGEHLLVIDELVRKAKAAWYRPDGRRDTLDDIRKLTAVGVACMEHHGWVERE